MFFPFYFSSYASNINLFKQFELIPVKNYTRCKGKYCRKIEHLSLGILILIFVEKMLEPDSYVMNTGPPDILRFF